MNKGKSFFNLNKYAQTLPVQELVEFNDEQNNEPYNNPQVIDWDEKYGDLPTITEDEVGSYIADNYEDEIQNSIEEQQLLQEPEVPLEVTDEELPEFGTNLDALNFAVENNKVVRINYITEGKTPRGNKKLKREIGLLAGMDITRIVEPHHVFTAGTGNTLVVTYDRSIRGTRAYIIDNIVNYVFTGKEFRKRMRVLPGGQTKKPKVKPMNNEIFENLEQVANSLDNKGLVKSASIVTDSMKALLQVKTAQYVGVQGYYIRNNRCWQNCYRQKRTNEENAQKVWTDCLEEYQKSINNDGSDWDKYANEEDKKFIKTASEDQKKLFKEESKILLNSIKEKIKKGMGAGEAVFISLEERQHDHFEKVSDVAQHLTFIADNLNEAGYKDLSKKLAYATIDLIKEADFKGNPGGFLGPLNRGYQAVKNKLVGRGGKSDVVKKLQDVINRANTLVRMLNRIPATQASNETRIVTAKQPWENTVVDTNERQKQKFQNDKGRFTGQSLGNPNESNIPVDINDIAQNLQQPQEAPVQSPIEEAEFEKTAPTIPTAKPNKPNPYNSGLNQEYYSFVNDTNTLVSELSGYMTGKDSTVATYAKGAVAYLQNFINESSVMKSMKSGSELRQFLRSSLSQLVNGLQGVIATGQVGQQQRDTRTQPEANRGTQPEARQINEDYEDYSANAPGMDDYGEEMSIDQQIDALIEQAGFGDQSATQDLMNLKTKLDGALSNLKVAV